MEANVGYKRLRIKDNGEEAFIPNNDIARLMYYLQCVFAVLKCNSYSEYTNYNNYYNLSNSDIMELIRLVKIFNPQILIGAKVFVLEENLNKENRFIEITDETMNIHANEEIVIGGIVTKVLKIMLFKSHWINNIYFNPLKRLTQRMYYPPILPPPVLPLNPPPVLPLNPPPVLPLNPPPVLPLNPPPVLPLNPPPVYGVPYIYNNNYNSNDEGSCCCTIF